MDGYPTGRGNGRGDGGVGISGGGDLCLTPPENSCTVHCDQDHSGPVFGGGEITVDKGVQDVVGSGGPELGGDADGVSGGGTVGEGVGGGRGSCFCLCCHRKLFWHFNS